MVLLPVDRTHHPWNSGSSLSTNRTLMNGDGDTEACNPACDVGGTVHEACLLSLGLTSASIANAFLAAA